MGFHGYYLVLKLIEFIVGQSVVSPVSRVARPAVPPAGSVSMLL